MNIDIFGSILSLEVELFLTEWREGNREQYPLEMPEGDWVEQFIMYLCMEKPHVQS